MKIMGALWPEGDVNTTSAGPTGTLMGTVT